MSATDGPRGHSKTSQRDGRKFAVSHNRGDKSHRVRYVETGGAAVDQDECTFCDAVPALETPSDKKP